MSVADNIFQRWMYLPTQLCPDLTFFSFLQGRAIDPQTDEFRGIATLLWGAQGSPRGSSQLPGRAGDVLTC